MKSKEKKETDGLGGQTLSESTLIATFNYPLVTRIKV